MTFLEEIRRVRRRIPILKKLVHEPRDGRPVARGVAPLHQMGLNQAPRLRNLEIARTAEKLRLKEQHRVQQKLQEAKQEIERRKSKG